MRTGHELDKRTGQKILNIDWWSMYPVLLMYTLNTLTVKGGPKMKPLMTFFMKQMKSCRLKAFYHFPEPHILFPWIPDP